ncbi:hypothetical protein P5673_020405 [Acropora cervicornis]|uniref:Reverse transcriptase domain-containing protein n=1 Tax=Acropora cervicornis TaxID=6130 RepID=A0AAD9Q9N1_ACRCE|nr:hypothetical protein P5673_020405 [Acropora cervicornis]
MLYHLASHLSTLGESECEESENEDSESEEGDESERDLVAQEENLVFVEAIDVLDVVRSSGNSGRLNVFSRNCHNQEKSRNVPPWLGAAFTSHFVLLDCKFHSDSCVTGPIRVNNSGPIDLWITSWTHIKARKAIGIPHKVQYPLIITSTVLDLITLLPWLSQSLSICEGFENNQYTVGVFIDLKKAFDTDNHEILLDKPSFYGIRGIPLAWLASYLSHAQTTVCHGS